MWAVAITVTSGGDTSTAGVLLEQENQALTEENIDDGSPGANSVRYAAVASGTNNVTTTIGANST
jgi:predicted secreted protein